MHEIFLEEDYKPYRDHQRRVNPYIREVVRKEALKLLEVGVIYLISYNKCVSHVDIVHKKAGITIIKNDKDEFVATRTITGWRICIDYRKLNKATQKYHFMISFIDEMFERLTKHSHIYYFDEYSGFSKSLFITEIKKNDIYLSVWYIC